MKTPIIIDTDPGIDDAVALAIALFSSKLDVKLITTVAGNVSLDKVTYNALRLLKYFNKHIPVAAGAATPLIEPFEDASHVHGKTGLEGFEFDEPDETLLLKETAVEAIKNTLIKSTQKVTIIPIGPLTNIALVLQIYPQLKEKIEKIVFMGGALERGNKGVYSEFNIGTDPEAAEIVFTSDIPLVMAPMELGEKAIILPEDTHKFKTLNKTGHMLYTLFETHRKAGIANGLNMYDSCTIAYLLNPTLFTQKNVFVAVELQGYYTRGATVVDLEGFLGDKKPNITVLTDVDKSAFQDWFFESLSNCI